MSKRELSGHRVNAANDELRIVVGDGPGDGGACHRYEITGYDASGNPSAKDLPAAVERGRTVLVFQNGPIPEAGVNGVTQEALIAVCVDRLQGFQAGPFACRENALALTKLQEAQMWLQKRTRDRQGRGVEGTHRQ